MHLNLTPDFIFAISFFVTILDQYWVGALMLIGILLALCLLWRAARSGGSGRAGAKQKGQRKSRSQPAASDSSKDLSETSEQGRSKMVSK